MDRFWSKVQCLDPDECWPWCGSFARAYGAFWLDGKTQQAHRVAYVLSKGEIPEGMMVRHTCDNPPCVNPNHLVLGTNDQNREDMVSRGRSAYGENSGNAKLTDQSVSEIRSREGYRGIQKALALEYGVSQVLISMIRRNKIWKHLKTT